MTEQLEELQLAVSTDKVRASASENSNRAKSVPRRPYPHDLEGAAPCVTPHVFIFSHRVPPPTFILLRSPSPNVHISFGGHPSPSPNVHFSYGYHYPPSLSVRLSCEDRYPPSPNAHFFRLLPRPLHTFDDLVWMKIYQMAIFCWQKLYIYTLLYMCLTRKCDEQKSPPPKKKSLIPGGVSETSVWLSVFRSSASSAEQKSCTPAVLSCCIRFRAHGRNSPTRRCGPFLFGCRISR